MTEEQQKPWNIQERTFEYSLRAIKLYQFLQEGKDGTGYIIGKQYLRAATSIGANITEAQSGESRADFIHKCQIAVKEARESLYWLKLLAQAEIVSSNRIKPLIQETEELIAIITKIIVKTKENTNNKRS
ncbi:MAG: four helix bundle protein [Hydrococcus sp. RU_2_2]|jgi:four helix bundle protein|nr:four helix bundle protein [Hydrococcus sp. RU_2_2]NJP18899.1 four helix bundle protein [Hydrococcus sp. CRU_1_1]